MNIDKRIKAFASLGDYLENISQEEFQTITESARNQNPWFTEESIRIALTGVRAYLNINSLRNWIGSYRLPVGKKKIAIVMAGNIPLVGFHDLLCVLISGYSAQLKLSSKDQFLINWIIEKLIAIAPDFRDQIQIADQLKNFDAVIATGSDNTSRYFDFYFGKYPNIIRRNRTGVAILNGTESPDELEELGRDVFTYFGLGCRNISKLFVPEGYSFVSLLPHWQPFENIIHHHKYCNNYDYQKSILLINSQPFLDNGFVLLQQSEKIVSPISVLFYEEYENEADLQDKLSKVKEKIQVIEGNTPLCSISFGRSQQPQLTDYADNIDTMAFLSSL